MSKPSLLLAAAAIALLGGATGAQAGEKEPMPAPTLELSDVPYVSGRIHYTPRASFDDIYHFTLSVESDIGLSLGQNAQQHGASAILAIDGLAASLYDESRRQLARASSGEFGMRLGAGAYFWDVSGLTKGVYGGAYTVSMFSRPAGLPVVSPVPEPGTGILLSAGTGVVGLITLRRRRARREAGAVVAS